MTELFLENNKWKAPRRFFRREFEREVVKVEHYLWGVVGRFVGQIFEEEDIHSECFSPEYVELYNFYNAQFASLVKMIGHKYKLRYCVINEHFFSENFKPIEQLKSIENND